MMPRIRSKIHGEDYPSQSRDKTCDEIPLPSIIQSETIPCELLEALPAAGIHELHGIPFQFGYPVEADSDAARHSTNPTSCTIPVNGAYDSFLFLYAAGHNAERIAWQPLVQTGEYTIVYEDGTTIHVPIEYGGNIMVWNRRPNVPMNIAYYRHQGYVGTYFMDAFLSSKTKKGNDMTIYGYEWLNPWKGKKVISITLTAKGDTDSSIMLFALTGIRRLRDDSCVQNALASEFC